MNGRRSFPVGGDFVRMLPDYANENRSTVDEDSFGRVVGEMEYEGHKVVRVHLACPCMVKVNLEGFTQVVGWFTQRVKRMTLGEVRAWTKYHAAKCRLGFTQGSNGIRIFNQGETP